MPEDHFKTLMMHQPLTVGLNKYQEETLRLTELNQEGKAFEVTGREAKFIATKDGSESLSDMLSI